MVQSSLSSLLPVSVTQTRVESYSGPIPPPEILSHLNDIIPGGAERVLAMAERQSAHRIEIEKSHLKEQQRQSNRGQFFAFFVTLVLIASGTYLAALGHEVVSGMIFGGTMISIAGVFLHGKRQQRADLRNKEAANPDRTRSPVRK